MVHVKREGILLEKTPLAFENEGVLNPAVIREGEFVHIFYRAVSIGYHSTIGYCELRGLFNVVERSEMPVIFPQYDYESQGVEDPPIVKIDDLYYLSYTAYDGVNALGALATSKDLIHWEKQGLIVPQITYNEFNYLANSKNKLNEKYHRYNEHDRISKNSGRKVLLWDKNLIFFPRKINNKFCFLHRIKPDIQIVVTVSNLKELTPQF